VHGGEADQRPARRPDVVEADDGELAGHAEPEGSRGGQPAEFADEQVSIVVNNAGIAGPVAPLIDISAAEWDEVLAVNVRGVFLICRAFLPTMIAGGRGEEEVAQAVIAMLAMPGLCGADIDLSAGMIAR
jgi:NAD(P)-dependent dehydrogenase (short-subunit alcohol dehydrogenase family)